MANKFENWIDNNIESNTQNYSTFLNDSQRQAGFQSGEPASSIRVNSALRQANLVVCALMDVLAPNNQTIDLQSSREDVAQVISAALVINGRKILTDTCDDLNDLYTLLTNHQNHEILGLKIDLGAATFSTNDYQLRYYNSNGNWGWGNGTSFGPAKESTSTRSINGRYLFNGIVASEFSFTKISVVNGSLGVSSSYINLNTRETWIPNTSAAEAEIDQRVTNISSSTSAPGTITLYYMS